MKLFGFLTTLLLLLPTVASAQPTTRTMPPTCLAAGLSDGTCVPVRQGVRAVITDAASPTVCSGGGSTTVTCEYSGSTWLPTTSGRWVGARGDSILNSTDGTFIFSRDETGTVTILGADDSSPAGTTYDTTGAGIITVGSADALNVRLVVDTDVQIINGATGPVTLDLRDYADTSDDDMAHVIFSGNCTTTSTGAEDCDLDISLTEAGSNVVRMQMDGDGDIVFPPEKADGGNATLNYKINGIPKIAGFSAGVGNDGSETTNVDFGDSETPNTDWTQTANITTADDTTTWRVGSASLEMVVGATPSAGNGADNALGTGDQDWSADESFGLWVYCTIAFSSGDWVLGITDNASEDVTTTFPAYSTANTWQWMELEIGSITDADKNIITDIAIDLSSAGATTFAAGATCNFDGMWKWDAAEEMALGQDIYEGGILSMFSVITAGASITPILEVEDTDFFVHYETGNDFIVPITDLNADSLWGTAALE